MRARNPSGEEIGILVAGSDARMAGRVTTTDEVDQDDTEGPDIGGMSRVRRPRRPPLRETLVLPRTNSNDVDSDAKVDSTHPSSVLAQHNVHKLAIAVGDTLLMQAVDTVEDLEEDGANKSIVPCVLL